MPKNNRGFTLIEMMIVIALLGSCLDILFSFYPMVRTLGKRETRTDAICRAARIASALDHLTCTSTDPLVENGLIGHASVSATGSEGRRWTLKESAEGLVSLIGSGGFDMSVRGTLCCTDAEGAVLVSLEVREAGIPQGEGAFAFLIEPRNNGRM